MTVDYVLTCDGGSLNNQDPTTRFGYGSYQIECNGRVYGPYKHEFGLGVTNNEAEYRALIMGLRHIAHYAPVGSTVEVRLDPQLIINQVLGTNKVKAVHLRRHVQVVREIIRDLGGNVTFVKIPGVAMKAILGH